LSRLKGARSRLSAGLSDRLYAVASIYALAEDVLGDGARVRDWFSAPQHGLGGNRPQALLASEFGRSQVRGLLKRIEHGFLA
jgi:putative toxin-antitoxin system antitoxin component (TIGR02293 family)